MPRRAMSLMSIEWDDGFRDAQPAFAGIGLCSRRRYQIYEGYGWHVAVFAPSGELLRIDDAEDRQLAQRLAERMERGSRRPDAPTPSDRGGPARWLGELKSS